jgi:hypothetical protein
MKPQREKYINAGILLSFAFIFVGMFAEMDHLTPIGFLLAGAILVVFSRDVALQRYRIDKETKNEFLKSYLFASETVERNRFVVLVVGAGLLIAGLVIALAVYGAR